MNFPSTSAARVDASRPLAAHLLFRLTARDDGDKYVDPVIPTQQPVAGCIKTSSLSTLVVQRLWRKRTGSKRS